MSQHYLTKPDGNLTAQYGYDRPLNYFYLVIHKNRDTAGEELVYSNLDELNPSLSIERIIELLNKYQFEFDVEQIAKLLESDRRTGS